MNVLPEPLGVDSGIESRGTILRLVRISSCIPEIEAPVSTSAYPDTGAGIGTKFFAHHSCNATGMLTSTGMSGPSPVRVPRYSGAGLRYTNSNTGMHQPRRQGKIPVCLFLLYNQLHQKWVATKFHQTVFICVFGTIKSPDKIFAMNECKLSPMDGEEFFFHS